MDLLRTLTSALSHYDPDAADNSPPANYRKAVRLTAQIGSLVATMGRWRTGGGPIEPDPVLGHAANFLYMLTGERPSGLATRAFDVALVLHADHELNASTFAARVAAATLTDIHSTIVGADRHAQGAAARRRERRRDAAAARDRRRRPAPTRPTRWSARSSRGRKRFPASATASTTPKIRARRTCARCRAISASATGQPIWFEMSQRIEALVKAEKKLNANVDFYSASTYHSLGIAVDLFTPIFAVSRISGWTAHVLEQYANNRLIRPRADYIGPEYPQRYTPVEAR